MHQTYREYAGILSVDALPGCCACVSRTACVLNRDLLYGQHSPDRVHRCRVDHANHRRRQSLDLNLSYTTLALTDTRPSPYMHLL